MISDETGATLWCGTHHPGRVHDHTAVRLEGIDALLNAYPEVRILVDSGYRGLAKSHPGQVEAPPLKLRPGAAEPYRIAYEHKRMDQSSRRIAVEHTIAELKWWRTLQRFIGRRELLPQTVDAVAALVSSLQDAPTERRTQHDDGVSPAWPNLARVVANDTGWH